MRIKELKCNCPEAEACMVNAMRPAWTSAELELGDVNRKVSVNQITQGSAGHHTDLG